VPGIDNSTFPDREAQMPELFSPPADMKRLAVRDNFPEFRTLPAAGQEDLRVAFGSCRKRDGGYHGQTEDKGKDVLKLLGQHLRNQPRKRLTAWPHFLLMLGDQIYADDIDLAVVRSSGVQYGALPSLDEPPGRLKAGAVAGTDGFQCAEYEDFAQSHIHAWTDPDVALLFANLPVFMMFDDHDITDDWNITSGWLAQALQDRKWVAAITNGLIAYWMYQGWGNPLPAGGTSDPRVNILAESARTGDDVINDLRQIIRPDPGHYDYYYTIESDPRVTVIDARLNRKFVAPATSITPYVSIDDDMLGEAQWKWLEKQLKADGPVVLCSSVPLLQFPYADIGFLTLVRPDVPLILKAKVISQNVIDFAQTITDGDVASLNVEDKLESARRDIDADGWASFPASFARLSKLLSQAGPCVFLSGDVHYSYVNYGPIRFPPNSGYPGQPLFLHAVSSPLRNQWVGQKTKTNVKRSIFVDNPSMKALEDTRKRLTAAAPSQPYSPSVNGYFTLRVFYPNPVAAFSNAARADASADYTYLNNVGVLQVSKDRKTANVVWYGAGSSASTPLEIIGKFATPPGTFVK